MSYGSGGGGTLTLPSPNGVHHVDVSAAVRSLRRSLSRSPSKLNIARAYSQSSESTISTPGSPSPCRIIQRPMPPASAPQLSHQHSQANGQSTPFRSAVKLSLRSVKPKAASAKPLSRARVSPRSPVKRALVNTADSGNSVTLSSPSPPAANALLDQENHTTDKFTLPPSPTSRKPAEKQSTRHSIHSDVSGASANTFPRFFDFKADSIPSASISPLKRSDVFMNSEQASVDCPVAKRRSLHGFSGALMSEPDDVFDATSPTPQNFDIHEDPNKEYDLVSDSPFFRDEPASPTPTVMPRRSDSLRRSTLQQRQGDKSSWGRRQGERSLAQMGSEVPSPMPRITGRPRVSLDQFVQPTLPRDSPFSSQAPLPNPSLHLLDRPHLQAQPHPLSRSVTTSSSTSSLADESPSHIPVLFEKPRAHPFARSMPVGARPLFENNKGAATPAYKNAKPFQDAFKSTGLISKVNRNPELEQATFRESKMPDTPCKKPIYPSNTYPPSSGGGKGRQRHSFGSPSSPFALERKESFSFGAPEKASSLFKSFQPAQPNHGRKMSMFSDIDTQNLDDNDEFPPTPTRSVFFRSVGNSKTVGDSPFVKTTTPASISSLNFRDVHQMPDSMCKSVSFCSSTGANDPKQTYFEPDQTRGALEAGLSSPMFNPLSFGRARASRGLYATTPEPLQLHSVALVLSSPKKVQLAKDGLVITASPLASLDKFVATNSPKTPCESTSLMPPDPSSLSISGHQTPNGAAAFGGTFPPATPTSRMEQFGGFADRRMSITPVNGGGLGNVDMVLKSRFEHVELIGKGEFSQVFKVTQASEAASMSQNGTPGTPPTPSEARVFAVKKIRFQFFSAKDREAKLREVHILKILRGRPHVLQYVDSWEKQFHLYIQSEYCEEGSLSSFLGSVGSGGRLDEFRIWKILIEASMGLQSIHEAGIIHLDLKPENILVNYEGQLKIGDFGLATQWPAARGIEGEGDRRYIAPEILNGKYDKPADIFSLGLIMFEIASNVWLPDNGPHWLALRQGNFAAVPIGPLTGRESDALPRDATGMPISGESDVATEISPYEYHVQSNAGKAQEFPFDFMSSPTHDPSNLFGPTERDGLRHPPDFMVKAENAHSLDQIVQWMLSPNPATRPTVQQLLEFESIQWVTTHRRAGATVFEGNWGPHDDGEIDTEMADV